MTIKGIPGLTAGDPWDPLLRFQAQAQGEGRLPGVLGPQLEKRRKPGGGSGAHLMGT